MQDRKSKVQRISETYFSVTESGTQELKKIILRKEGLEDTSKAREVEEKFG